MIEVNAWRWPEGLVSLLRSADVEMVELQTFSRPRAFLGREVSSEVRLKAREARLQSAEHGTGFWPNLLPSLSELDPATRRAVYRQAVQHGEAEVETMELYVDELGTMITSGGLAHHQPRQVTALTSKVRLSGGESRHIPLLDLTTKSSAVAQDVCSVLGLDGVLVDSGRSYHFFGAATVTDAELWRVLARSQLLAPLVDERWVSHQFLAGFCALRISTEAQDPDRLEVVAHTTG